MAIQYDDYFLKLIESNEFLKSFKEDYGLKLISNALDYKIKGSQKAINDEIRESYNPTKEETLLAYLMYKIGYLKFKKPMVLTASVKSDSSVLLPAGSRFSDGSFLYYTSNSVNLIADSIVEVDFELIEKYSKIITVENGSVYSYYDTNISYKDISSVDIKKDGNTLVYSQNLIKLESDYTIEIKTDGTVSVVFFLNNEFGLNIKSGDELEVEITTTSDKATQPDNLGIVESGYDVVVSNINVKSNYEPFMSLQDMQNMIKYGRKNLGDLVLNEDFRQMILSNVSGIKEIKVWQQREEDLENEDLSNINKVFVSYILENGLVNDNDVTRNIISLIQSNVYGREAIVRTANIYQLSVGIVIYTDEALSLEWLEYIKDMLSGFYDDIHIKISESYVYMKVYSYLSTKLINFRIDVNMTDKGDYFNNKFYSIEEENINIGQSEF